MLAYFVYISIDDWIIKALVWAFHAEAIMAGESLKNLHAVGIEPNMNFILRIKQWRHFFALPLNAAFFAQEIRGSFM